MSAPRSQGKLLQILLPGASWAVLALIFAPTAVRAQNAPETQPTTMPTTRVALNFRDATLDSVLVRLSKDFGVRIAIDEAPKETRIDTLISEPRIPLDEAVSMLNQALKPKGYTAILAYPSLKVIDRSKARKQDIPVVPVDNLDQLKEGDDLITAVIPVKSLDAVRLRQDLTPLISTDADVASNAASNSLIITDTSSNLRRIVKIIFDLDTHQAGASTLKVIQLRHGDADSAAKLIMTIFRPDLNQQGGQGQGLNPLINFFPRGGGGGGFGGGGRGGGGFGGGGFGGGGRGGGGFFGGGGGGGGGRGAASAADEGAQGKINAASDERTNSVVVTGPQDQVDEVVKMLDQIDNNPLAESTFFMYRLENADATNLQNVLNALFSGSSTGLSTSSNRSSSLSSISGSGLGTGGFGGGGGRGGGGGGFGGGGRGGGGGGGGFGGGGGGFGGGGGGFGGGGGLGGRGGFGGGGLGGTGSGGQGALSDLVGHVFVVADTYTNSLLVDTASKFADQVKEVIKELDRPVPQVLIKVLVAEVTHDNNADFGVDYSILNTRPNGLGQSYSQSFGAPTGGLVVGLIEDKINATLHALAQQNKLDVLSRPYILASDNQEAYVLIGQEVPIVTSNTTTALGQTVSNYNYQSVGVILDVIPHINPKGLVTLQVSPQISQLTAQTVTVGPGVSVPVIASRTAISQVAIKDGQTIVIGGLMQDQKTLTVNKVPILGDIPILKYAFSRTTVDKTKTELLIFLTPHVAPQPDLLKPMSKDELKGTRLTPNAVEPGTFDEHLRGMERGTAQP